MRAYNSQSGESWGRICCRYQQNAVFQFGSNLSHVSSYVALSYHCPRVICIIYNMTGLEIVYPYAGIYSSKHLEHCFRLLEELVKLFLSWLLVLSQHVLISSQKKIFFFIVIIIISRVKSISFGFHQRSGKRLLVTGLSLWDSYLEKKPTQVMRICPCFQLFLFLFLKAF